MWGQWPGADLNNAPSKVINSELRRTFPNVIAVIYFAYNGLDNKDLI